MKFRLRLELIMKMANILTKHCASIGKIEFNENL